MSFADPPPYPTVRRAGPEGKRRFNPCQGSCSNPLGVRGHWGCRLRTFFAPHYHVRHYFIWSSLSAFHRPRLGLQKRLCSIGSAVTARNTKKGAEKERRATARYRCPRCHSVSFPVPVGVPVGSPGRGLCSPTTRKSRVRVRASWRS